MVNQIMRSKRNMKYSLNSSVRSQSCNTGNRTAFLSNELILTRGTSAYDTFSTFNFSAPSFILSLSPNQQSLDASVSLSHYLHSIMPENAVTKMIFTQANYLQTPFHPAVFAQRLSTSHSPVQDALKRFVEIAMKYVTSHDKLMENFDGKDMVPTRLFRSVPVCECWLALQQFNTSFAYERSREGKSAVERLSRVHISLLGRIIERNMLLQSSDKDLRLVCELTRAIDSDLKQSANILSSEPWIIPNLSSSATQKDILKNSATLTVQMHHYYLSLLLHQPILLRGNVHHASAYRGLDPKAWIASVKFLLAHINRHQVSVHDHLEQQRLQDIDIVY
ncbi:hypothetical protein TSTA_098610 [Talaromyces stipitatus ATCC 10500]|uniref:Uncharacterized protein n=1 Tax=Talaromyces stipitatus (strain ATCC 10500 / CBS 375.48 / QM 6759 / NRRL 1006) TaxID=441959 RepID=B8MMN7_TALSN|nr:uncharacterized protein TSTA_098610 [Talaromyces stipitatus ATCC 10500]EED13604.1 hypothetical protein TSTA_098610 [Talaromyces stipitatus ATCC 10500]